MPKGLPLERPERSDVPRLAARSRLVKEGSAGSERRLIDVLRGGEGPAILTLGSETSSQLGYSREFSPDGRTLAWTYRDGTVVTADLDELNRRLTPLGRG